MEKRKIERTYYCILCEMSNFECKMSDAESTLVKKIKEYLMSVLNSQTKHGKLYDPIFACSVIPFYGNYLSWNKMTWRKSAHILYSFFKASILIDAIKKYEVIFKETIVHDYLGMLNYFYSSISQNTEIDYWGAPGIGAAFNLVPLEVLENKLKKFKELYE